MCSKVKNNHTKVNQNEQASSLTVQLHLHGQFRFPHVWSECKKKTAAGSLCPDLVVHGAQQLSKPVEGLKLPADPHKIEPLQAETRPAVTAQGSREIETERQTTPKRHKLLPVVQLETNNSQQSVQHAGERRDSDSSRHAETDIVVKDLFGRTAEWTVDVEPECKCVDGR